jgi:hypothetical protein
MLATTVDDSNAAVTELKASADKSLKIFLGSSKAKAV